MPCFEELQDVAEADGLALFTLHLTQCLPDGELTKLLLQAPKVHCAKAVHQHVPRQDCLPTVKWTTRWCSRFNPSLWHFEGEFRGPGHAEGASPRQR